MNNVLMNYLPFKIFYPKILFIECIHSLSSALKWSTKILFNYFMIASYRDPDLILKGNLLADLTILKLKDQDKMIIFK